ncbi:hypothetical protein GYA37_00745 [candidate division WWE3 bacterium]|uniref:Uncharacterized protein n=1 Tax=candidate division WWE3 bacterium TaxID=2053526 RepID=A0A7X9HSM4_UNCKA|nr:hypothetical protein [candidate division WWE3 bacterium]
MADLYVGLGGILGAILLAALAVRQLGDFNYDHPEMKKGEVFITNADAEDLHHVGWKTKRCGKKAYDAHGRCISESYWQGSFPVFVQKSEMIQAGFRIFQIRFLCIQILDSHKR